MRVLLHIALGIALISQAGAVQAAKKEPLRLLPSTKWQVDYAEKRCRLLRAFGEGKQRVVVLFDKFGPEFGYRVTLVGAQMRTNESDASIWLQFGPSEKKQQVSFVNGNFADESALIIGGVHIAGSTFAERKAAKKEDGGLIEPTPIDPKRAEAVRFVEIIRSMRKTITLETGPLRAPFAAMDKCVDNLMSDWGIDVEKHKKLTRKVTPIGDPAKWIISSDYPLTMLAARQPAWIQSLLSVDADGKLTGCQIQETTRPKKFDDAVCKALMRRSEFLPALDADGKALPSYLLYSVHFQIAP